MHLLDSWQTKQADDAFEKLEALLRKLRRQKKNFSWQGQPQTIDQSVQKLKETNRINNLQYMRFTTFSYSLRNLDTIDGRDWNSISMFIQKFLVTENSIQKTTA